MSDTGMYWSVVIALVVVGVMVLALLWQILRRKEAVTGLQHCNAQLHQLKRQSQLREAELCEQTAAACAEKAHVEQLQRQLGFAQEELVVLCAKSRDNSLLSRCLIDQVSVQVAIK